VETTQPKTDAADEEEELLYRWLGPEPEAPVSATPGTNSAGAGAAAAGGEGGPPEPEKTPDTIPATGDAAGQERTT
jgi:hypothetical protein